jgi:hypothetical protein
VVLVFVYVLFLAVLGLDLRADNLEPFHQPFFVKDFFETVSSKLFAWGGFKPRSS